MLKRDHCYKLRQEGLSYREIAAIVGIKHTSVGVHLAHAKKHLKTPVRLSSLEYRGVSDAEIQAWWKARGY